MDQQRGKCVRRVVSILAAVLCTASLVAGLAALCVCGTCDAGPSVRMAMGWIWISSAALWLALGAAAWSWRAAGDEARRAAVASAVVLVVALAARLAVVATASPQLSDDIHRYVHDGRTLAGGENPYRSAPAERLLRHPDEAALITRVNNNDLVTIYQPLSQLAFAALASMGLGQADDFEHRIFRAGFIGADMLIVIMLLLRLRAEGRSPFLAALYAWHPLVLCEVAGSGHQEPVGIALLFASLWALGAPAAGGISRGRTLRRDALGAALFSAAVAVKPVVLPLALPILWARRREPARIVVGVLTAAAVFTSLYLPFALMEGGLAGLFETSRRFIDAWSHNASVHTLLTELLGRHGASRACAALLVGVLCCAMAARCDLWRAAMVTLFAGVLLSTTAHPWYLLWALAFLPLRFSAALWCLSLSIAWSYVVLIDLEAWHLPGWVLALEYVPVYVVLVWELGRWARQKMPNAECRMPNGKRDSNT